MKYSLLDKHNGNIVLGVIVVILFLITLVIALAGSAFVGSLSGPGTGSGLISDGGYLECTDNKLSQDQQDKVNEYRNIYQTAADRVNIPWEFLAGLHYRETNFGNSASNGDGPFQVQGARNTTMGIDAAVEAGNKAKSLAKGVYNVDLTKDSSDETVKLAFLAYNRGNMYKNHSCTYNQSPYVMNNFDQAHKDMTWPNSQCEPSLTRGRVEHGRLGGFTVYASLRGCSYSGTGVCSDAIPAAHNYFNKGIGYTQGAGRCGPLNTKGPNGVFALDCSGFTTRVYHDANLLPERGWCNYTLGIATDHTNYVRIASDVETAKRVLQPGDLILFGMGPASGPPQKTGSSHVVIYGGRSNSKDIILESGGNNPGDGPHQSVYNVFTPRREFYGVYRSRQCK